MKLKFNDKEIELVYSCRSGLYFEQIQGKPIDFSNFTNNDVITLFYCVFISSLQKVKMPIISMLDFLDVIDENNGEKCIIDFTNWYIDILQAQYEVINSMDEGGKDIPKKKRAKKN